VTADLAIVAMAAVTLVDRVLDHLHRMKVADRERLVGPVKQPGAPKRETAAEPAMTGPVPLERAS
jgi:hypothetical protein